MRKNVYFSKRLDTDLVEYMKANNFDEDFAQNVKRLMRDGIKFRNGGITSEQLEPTSKAKFKEPKVFNSTVVSGEDVSVTTGDEIDLDERLDNI